MKLYLRRQMVTTSKGMLGRRTERTYALYARIVLAPEERDLANDFELNNMLVYEHEYQLKGDHVSRDVMCTVDILVKGVELPCPQLADMMVTQSKLQKALEDTALHFQLARDIKSNSEVVVDIAPTAA